MAQNIFSIAVIQWRLGTESKKKQVDNVEEASINMTTYDDGDGNDVYEKDSVKELTACKSDPHLDCINCRDFS